MNRDTRLPFGKHKGKSLRQCDKGYLEWMATKMSDDFQEWKELAKDELKLRKEEDTIAGDLEKQADAFLRSKGFDPKAL